MSQYYTIIVLVILFLASVDPARILGVYPIPSISHQVVFRALTLELVNRGHEVVVITPDPVYKNQKPPQNLREIDISGSYKLITSFFTDKDVVAAMKRGVIMDSATLISMNCMLEMGYYMFQVPEVNKLLEDKGQKFDLVIVEGLTYSSLIFGEIFDAPVILFSSLYGTDTNYEAVGSVARHPALYGSIYKDNFGSGILNKIHQLYLGYKVWVYDLKYEQNENDFLKSKFGSDVPTIAELKKRVVLLLVNCHPVFDQNRPVTPATVYLGAAHLKPTKELPQDLKSYLDNSTRGVVYVSLGTNVRPSLMDKEFLDEFLNAFERIPYDILWKFDGDHLDGIPANVKIQKWFPQRDLLGHPSIKLFVMQGGLQSTDEAIDAEVPLVGIPFFADQFYNTNKYKELGIGVALDSVTMVADDLVKAVYTVANDPSYKQNMKNLKSIIRDQPETPIERAIWWTEHVLRHKQSKHLLGAAAQMSWSEYLMLDVLIYLIIGFIIVLILFFIVIIYIIRLVAQMSSYVKVKKQ